MITYERNQKMNEMLEADRIGGRIRTFSGRHFWPMDSRVNEVQIEDIGHALSMIYRFGGHCPHFYSVAQHSVLVKRNKCLKNEPKSILSNEEDPRVDVLLVSHTIFHFDSNWALLV